jgi:hypothetical protein
MEELIIPSEQEITRMSYTQCRRERIRLLNEIAFARGDETIGNECHDDKITACRQAIEAIRGRLESLSEKQLSRKSPHLGVNRNRTLTETLRPLS